MPSRRTVLAGGAGLSTAAGLPGLVQDGVASIAADLGRYIGFGSKQAGGAGDVACGEWLDAELRGAGYAVERQSVSTPFFEPTRAELTCGAAHAPVWPQPIVIPTASAGVTGRLVYVDPRGRAHGDLSGAVALIDLPFARWSSALAEPIRGPVVASFAEGARAALVVTNGPSGRIVALNADGRAPMFAGPVALLAPDRATPFVAAAARGETATLHVVGNGGRRPAFNLVGRIDRGAGRWLAVSTPRSGWFTCAGERGPGVATWLWLARWASRTVRDHDLAFICNSGHEYEYLGASEALKGIAPDPERTRFWLHLGANVAARDWHDGTRKPLPSPDPQRFLALSPALLGIARDVFAGEGGLEAPYSTDDLSAGELTEIVRAGYRSVAGVFGAHRFHHVDQDDARCVSVGHVAAVTARFRALLERVLAQPR